MKSHRLFLLALKEPALSEVEGAKKEPIKSVNYDWKITTKNKDAGGYAAVDCGPVK